MKKKYIIDTCSLINASKNYNINKKVFEEIWKKFDEMINEGLLISISEVKDEIKDNDLLKWSCGYSNFFVPITKEIQDNVKMVLKDFPLLIKIKSVANSNADPFIVAAAIEMNAIVITDEKISGGDNPHIPNVCKKYDIECISLLDFINTLFE